MVSGLWYLNLNSLTATGARAQGVGPVGQKSKVYAFQTSKFWVSEHAKSTASD